MEILSWNDLVPNSYSNVSLFSRSEQARATFSSCASCELVARDDDVLRRSLQTFEHDGTRNREKDGRQFWVHSRRRIETHVMEEEKYRTTATENGHVMLRQEGS